MLDGPLKANIFRWEGVWHWSVYGVPREDWGNGECFTRRGAERAAQRHMRKLRRQDDERRRPRKSPQHYTITEKR